METSVKTYWVYQTKNGKFYVRHTKGSWDAHSNGVSAKDITTESVEDATKFVSAFSEAPYCHNCLRGGKWVEVEQTTSYKVLVSDQKG